MKVNVQRVGAFTLIELLVVITVIAILMAFAVPGATKVQENAKISKDANNIKQIVLACRAFATEWDGQLPSFDPDAESGGDGGGGEEGESEFSNSADAFNVLIPEYLDTEAVFWILTKNPNKQRPPREDGELDPEEVTYCYVAGQSDTNFSRSPLVADGEMDGPGSYSKYHPWLKSKKAVVGFVGGHVQTMRLTSGEEGATIRTKDGLVEDIFKERGGGEDDSGGLLDTDPANILLPE